jgi:hypothetical protein
MDLTKVLILCVTKEKVMDALIQRWGGRGGEDKAKFSEKNQTTCKELS